MKVNIGLKESENKVVAKVLNQLLADEHVLYIKTRNAHWNVEGADFHQQHLFFESIYTELEVTIDDVAERVRSIGHYAVGTMKEYLELSHLNEMTHVKNDSKGYIKELLSDFESIIMMIRSNLEKEEVQNDAATEDFLISIIAAHEKTAWMLRSHLS